MYWGLAQRLAPGKWSVSGNCCYTYSSIFSSPTGRASPPTYRYSGYSESLDSESHRVLLETGSHRTVRWPVFLRERQTSQCSHASVALGSNILPLSILTTYYLYSALYFTQRFYWTGRFFYMVYNHTVIPVEKSTETSLYFCLLPLLYVAFHVVCILRHFVPISLLDIYIFFCINICARVLDFNIPLARDFFFNHCNRWIK